MDSVVRDAATGTTPGFPSAYRALRPIGRGSFGEVWQVQDVRTGDSRAAKILLSPEPAMRAAFFHEYAMLFRLRHPGLVRTYDWCELENGTPFFTMSWADGPVLEGASLSTHEKLRALWELVDSLTFIHSQGLVHADLKPDNIRYQESVLSQPLNPAGPRALCLLDFGLTLDRRQEKREGRGTVPYMAPEWFSDAQVNYRADLYSLGILIHAVFAGSPPFMAEDPLVIVQKHLEAQPPSLLERGVDVPADLDEATSRLLAKQPEVRDRGRELLARFLSERLGAVPGSGSAALAHHEATLGRQARLVSPQVLDLWLATPERRSVFFVRGGEGLEQERVLESIRPELARYHRTAEPFTDPGDPRLHAEAQPQSAMTALIVATDETATAWTAYLNSWLEGTTGPGRLAIAVNADRAGQHTLVLELSRLTRAGKAHGVTVGGLEPAHLHQLLERAAPGLEAPVHNQVVQEAAGNPTWMFALAHDALEGVKGEASRIQAVKSAQRAVVEESYPALERLAMSLLACADTEVDRSVLRALADVPWSQYLSRWLELGYVAASAGRMSWRRTDLAVCLLAGQTDERRRLLHRAWAEYWGSFAPDPGSQEHQYLVSHALESNAPRRAVRVGLEAARHWLDRHQAQRALEVLERTREALERIDAPPPAWVFEQVLLTSEARRVLARYAEAKEGLDRALEHPLIRGKQRWEAELYKRKGDLCKSLKQPEEGRQALEAALERFRALADKAEISHVLNNLGNIQFVAGDLVGALSRYTEALGLQRELERTRDIASTLNNIGGLLVLRSEYDRAVEKLSESVGLQRTLGDPEALARSLNNLSVAYVETGRYGEADTVLSESYRLNLASGKTGEQLFNLENLAAVSLARGEWPSAMGHIESGLKLCQASDERKGRLPFALVTVRVALAQGNYEEALTSLNEVDRLSEGLANPDTELAIQLARAEWDFCRGRFSQCTDACRAVVDRAGKEGLPSWVARGYWQMAQAELSVSENHELVRHYLTSALETAERIGALPEQIRSRTLLAEVEAAGGASEQASEHLRRVEKLMLECSSRPLFLPFSSALGAYYKKKGDLEMSLSAYDTARKLASYLAMPEWAWRFMAASGHVLVDMRRFDQASSYYRGAVEILALLAEKLNLEDREVYLQEAAKSAVETGLSACHSALVA